MKQNFIFSVLLVLTSNPAWCAMVHLPPPPLETVVTFDNVPAAVNEQQVPEPVGIDPSEPAPAPCALCNAVRNFDRVALVRLTAGFGLRVDTVCPHCEISPLSWAMDNAQAEFVGYIIQRQLAILKVGVKDVFFGTTLEDALRRGRADVTFDMLRLIKSDDKKIFFMSRALHIAAEIGFSSVVKDLLFPLKEKGTFVDVEDASGDTALTMAAAFGRLLCVKLLLLGGADVNHQNNAGYTALMLAIAGLAGNGHHVEVIIKLLESGSNPLLKSKDGITAISLAKAMNCYDTFAKAFETALFSLARPSRPVATLPQGSIRDTDVHTTSTVDTNKNYKDTCLSAHARSTISG